MIICTNLGVAVSGPVGGGSAKAKASYPGGRTPMVDIPGFAHPVTEYFLDDVIDITGHIPRHMRGKVLNSR